MNKILFLIAVAALILISNCSDNPVNGDDNIAPGRRDYVWTVDTLDGLISPRFRIWGSSPDDVWATTESSW